MALKTDTFSHPSATITNITLDAAGNTSLGGTLVTPSPLMFRNRFINGAMDVSQRGSSGTGSGVAIVFCVDRWILYTGGANLAWSQNTSLSVAGFPTGVAITGAAGNTSCNFAQRIESFNARDLANKTVTVSAWIYSTTAFTPALAASSPNAIDNFSALTYTSVPSFSAVPANTWTFVSTTFTAPANTANGLQIEFILGPHTTGTRYITGCQLELGTIATPFERRPIGTELQLCQRYYWRRAGNATLGYNLIGTGIFSNTTQANIQINFPTTMRTTPSLSFGGTVNLYDSSAQTALTAINTVYDGTLSNWILCTSTGPFTQGRAALLFTANASTNYFDASTEL
jgi:hypothetical protein